MKNGESRTRRILFNEISFILAIAGAVSGIIFWVANPQKSLEIEVTKLRADVDSHAELSAQIQNLKDNDMHTLEVKLTDLSTQLIETNKEIIKIQTLINERIPARK